jgi:hypothetical protein
LAGPRGSFRRIGLRSNHLGRPPVAATTHPVEASPPTWSGPGSLGNYDGAPVPPPARPRQPQRRGNGLACGAAAGPLHPAADRPLPRPPGHIPRRPAACVKGAYGPSDRPTAVLDPTAVPVGPPTTGRPGRGGGGERERERDLPPGRDRMILPGITSRRPDRSVQSDETVWDDGPS